MNVGDAVQLLALCATYDNRKPDPSGMAAASWADALQGLATEDCATAIRQHYRSTDRYIMPAHIRSLVVEIANSRQTELARQERKALEAKADPDVAQRVRAIIEQLAEKRKIPDDRSPHPKQRTELQRRARSVACPWCNANAGEACVNQGTRQPAVFVHDARLEVAARPAEAAS